MVHEYHTICQGTSPFATTALGLWQAGFHPVPIHPTQKRPVEYRRLDTRPGVEPNTPYLRGIDDWSTELYMQARPVVDSYIHMANYVEDRFGQRFGIGVLHTPHFIALDLDSHNEDLHNELIALYQTWEGDFVGRRGSKGHAVYFRAEGDIANGKVEITADDAMDILADGRQSVIPPSWHEGAGRNYYWLDDTISLADTCPEDLPLLSADRLQQVLGICQRYTKAPGQPLKVRGTGSSSLHRVDQELAEEAMNSLDLWVPKIGLANLKQTRVGYEATAHWRNGGSGKPLHERKRNLKIYGGRIYDYGNNRGYSPFSLIMESTGKSFHNAGNWLWDAIGMRSIHKPWTPKAKTAAPDDDDDPDPTVAADVPAEPEIEEDSEAPAESAVEVESVIIDDQSRTVSHKFAQDALLPRAFKYIKTSIVQEMRDHVTERDRLVEIADKTHGEYLSIKAKFDGFMKARNFAAANEVLPSLWGPEKESDRTWKLAKEYAENPPPVYVLKVSAGGGKTYASAQHLFDGSIDVIFSQPTNDLGTEFRDKLVGKEHGHNTSDIVMLRGSEAEDVDQPGKEMCHAFNVVRAAEECGVARSSICGPKKAAATSLRNCHRYIAGRVRTHCGILGARWRTDLKNNSRAI